MFDPTYIDPTKIGPGALLECGSLFWAAGAIVAEADAEAADLASIIVGDAVEFYSYPVCVAVVLAAANKGIDAGDLERYDLEDRLAASTFGAALATGFRLDDGALDAIIEGIAELNEGRPVSDLMTHLLIRDDFQRLAYTGPYVMAGIALLIEPDGNEATGDIARQLCVQLRAFGTGLRPVED